MKIAIIGSGNVGHHLTRAFAESGQSEVVSIASRRLEEIPFDADLYLIAVTDGAIAEVAGKMPPVDGVVAHTSGSVGMEVIPESFAKRGVFYPLQTFTKDAMLEYGDIPVFVEANNAPALVILKNAARLFSESVLEADSALRRKLHLAAVFACNFTNRLYGIADELMRESGLDFRLFFPLIRESVGKLRVLSPSEAQTGPASRGDRTVCEEHLRMLEDRPELCRIYSMLTDSISKSRKI